MLPARSEAGYLLACGLLAAIAAAFNWATGHRGIFLLDQSMVFDGGWRILQGQAPYKDFLIPFGPITFYVQALFFRLLGVNWSAMVFAACVINSLATMSTIRIVRLLGGGFRLLALSAGLMTAICFQAPFGTLWFEQTAMFFDLLALQAVVESHRASDHRRGFWLLAGGISLALAALSKQNFGLFFLPVVLAVVVAGELPDMRRACRSVALFGAGTSVAIAIFVLWVWMFSDLPTFVQRFLVVPSEIGRSRLTAHAIVTALSFNQMPRLFQFDLLGSMSGCVALLLAGFNFRGPAWRKMAPAGTAALLLPWYRSFTQATTANEWENNFAFVGLASCLGISLLLTMMHYISIRPKADRNVAIRLPTERTAKIVLIIVLGFWGAAVSAYEARIAWRRSVQQFATGALFGDTVRVRGLERLRWGEATSVDNATTLRKADFEDLVSYLSTKERSFFVMGDSTILYGLLGARSPQPLLYFQSSHSFLEREIPRLDAEVAASLESNRVGVVVREKTSFLREVHDAYPQFSLTWRWFTANFDHVADFGNYEVWERRPDAIQ